MSEKEFYNKDKKYQDEIDLGKILSNILAGLKKIISNILLFLFQFIDLIASKIIFIVSFLIIGVLIGIGYFYITKPYYESNMTLSSDYFKGELLNNSIQNINEVVSEGNTKVLSSLLQIPTKKAQNIRSIKLDPLLSQNYQMLVDLYSSDERYKGKLDSLLIYNNQSTFKLVVEVYDTAALSGLDTILVNYIKNNNFVKKRIEVDRENLNKLQIKLSKESGNLDTLKKSMATSIRSSGEAGRNGANNVILGERAVNPIDIYREDLSIYNQRQEVERQIALNAEIEVIEKFIPYAEPKSGSITKNAIKGAIAGLFLAFLIILYKMLSSGLTKLRYNLETAE